MDRSHDIEEANVAALYEASHAGCESTLNSLMQRDALILNKISLTSFPDTPLHIAVLHGHLEFTAALLRRKPNLTGRKDLRGRTALHLASAEGHAEIVRELLQANTDVCLSRDEDGRIPLHLAVMRGHIEVIKKLLIPKPNSFLEDLDGASVLHLCVKYNCLDALKYLLVESADDDGYSLNSKDNDGNSILHLAVMYGQTETIKYLLSSSKIKGEANAINRIGNTALDVLELGHRDFKYLKIQDMLMAAGVRRSKDLNSPGLLPTTQRHERAAQYINNEGHEPATAAQSWFKKWWAYFCLCGWVKHFKRQGRSNWVVETRGTLMLVATVIATVTFQAGINPPGGVWQQGCQDAKYGNYTHCTGKAIFSDINPNVYQFFLSFNTTSLVAALSVVLLITLGIPKRSKLFIWLLTLAMLIAVTFMLYTYFLAAYLVTSEAVTQKIMINRIYLLSLMGILLVVLVIAGVVLIYRLLAWMVKLLLKCMRCLTMSPTN
ncbi:serine/threonine-protein phosphatase 6 regulatory ankyrin repeat subunit B-like [Juglans microcarpa x Juglans regia]|uniref:serine/threonine-protein phosphatase 6 regulatory ankyrin repeat subunit B-like n=1 Tax=Juglans microcarpa x Juglans regia TaxID=2249226 RepID=UPI001B7F1DA2|nr:serine/threonine-protein phosphatase 6 regulatory ankyrin repeat subunit B-like [Juglans microcarpa x Juglans regia]